MSRILCLWFPRWPIQRQWVAHPTRNGQPLILTERDPRRGERVAECCPWVESLGVRRGMPVVEATSLLTRSPRTERNDRPLRNNRASPAPASGETFLQLPFTPTVDREALTDLAVWCQQFSPVVGLEESADPSSLLLDITGSAPRLGGEASLVRSVETACRERGYRIRAAVAPTLGAAWALCHASGDILVDWQRPQDRKQVRESLTPIVDGPLIEVLADVPLAALRIDPDQQETLQALGVVTMKQLLQLPRAGLRRRFGDRLLLRLDQALGTIPEPIRAIYALPPLSVHCELEYPTPRVSGLAMVLKRLTAQLADHLQQRNLGAVQLECTCHLQDRTRQAWSLGLYQPTACGDHFYQLYAGRLESVRLTAPVVAVDLCATVTAEREYSSAMLWGTEPHYDHRSLGALIEKLSHRLGPESVVGARLLADVQPERAYRTIPLSGKKPAPVASTLAARARHRATTRPLSLYSQPRMLSRIMMREHGMLTSFHDGCTRYQVRAWDGPERVETGWWRGKMISRDYYRVEDLTGCRFWIFQERHTGHWYLHGRFD